MPLAFGDKYNGYYLADAKGKHLKDVPATMYELEARQASRRMGETVKVFRAYAGRFPERLVLTVKGRDP